MMSEVITINGAKLIVYDLDSTYEVHIVESAIKDEIQALYIINYLADEWFLPEEKPVGIKLIPEKWKHIQ